MIRSKSFASSMGLTCLLSLALPALGCGSSGGGPASTAAGQHDAEIPEGIALQLRTCAAEHEAHLGRGQHFVTFEVKLASDGEVDSVAIHDSTLRDDDLELCMAKALRGFSEDDLLLRRSDVGPRRFVTPESRGLMSQAQALTCFASPPCVLALALVIGAAYVAVTVLVHAAAESSKVKPRTAPTATTVPVATATPGSGVDCKKQKDICIELCSNTALPSGDGGFRFWNCVNDCMVAAGC